MVFFIFESLVGYINKKETITDDPIFRLHYQLTSVLLLAFSIIVSTKQFFGDPISCIPSARSKDPLDLLNNYCWSHTTFTLPKAYNKPMGWGTQEVAYDGIDNKLDGDDVIYHAYYQWVCFFLVLQALLFYLTRFFWINSYGMDLHKLISKKDIDGVAVYINATLNDHTLDVVTYYLCLVLNAVNVIAQMCVTNAFLRGEFITYGIEVLYFPIIPQVNRTDPMVKVFPLMTKCKFPIYGVGGSVEIRDSLCVLPINVINEKIFIFLWFWYATLAFISIFWIIFQLPLLFNKFRLAYIKWQTTEEVMTLLDNVIPKCHLGDWFLLKIVQKNYLTTDFNVLIDKLDKLIRKNNPEESHPLLQPPDSTKSKTNYPTKLSNADFNKEV